MAFKRLIATWRARNLSDHIYRARWAAIQARADYALRAHIEMRDRLFDRIDTAKAILAEAGVAADKKELVESSGAAISPTERALLELDASIFDSPAFFEQTVHELEVCSYVVNRLTHSGRAMMARYQQDMAATNEEWSRVRQARQGWFFQILLGCGLAQ